MSYRVVFPVFRDDVKPIVIGIDSWDVDEKTESITTVISWFDKDDAVGIEDEVDMEFSDAISMYLDSVIKNQVSDFLENTLELRNIYPWS